MRNHTEKNFILKLFFIMISISLSGCTLPGKKLYKLRATDIHFYRPDLLKLGIISLQKRGENILISYELLRKIFVLFLTANVKFHNLIFPLTYCFNLLYLYYNFYLKMFTDTKWFSIGDYCFTVIAILKLVSVNI